MRISAKAEYACVAMLELAATYNEPLPLRIKTITDVHGIDPRFMVQILSQLKTAGLVDSARGAGGGYKLTRPPEEISLGSVIRAVVREKTVHPPANTASAAFQAMHSVWNEIQTQKEQYLESLTLADLSRRTREISAPSYQI